MLVAKSSPGHLAENVMHFARVLRTAIRKAHTAGFTITVVSPDARTIKGRKRIAEALRHAGLEPEIVALLGWGTTYPGAEPPATPAALVEASAATEETTDDPTLTDEPSE